MKAPHLRLGLFAGWLLVAASTLAANYELRPATIANGGGVSAGGSYSFKHTIGQPVHGAVSGGSYAVGVGFWEQNRSVVSLALPDLTVSANPASVLATENLTANLSLSVSNRATTAASGVSLNILAPAGMRLQAVTNSAGTSQLFGASNAVCGVASLPASGSFTVSLTLRPNFLPPTSPLSVNLGDLTAFATSAEADLNPANNSLAVPLAVIAQTDWGDAQGGLPVTPAENGAYARYSPTGPWLGARWDNDGLGNHSLLADWDDTHGASDDEDGVTPLSPLYPGLPAMVMVVVTADCLVDAWADWNKNFSWADAGEKIFASLPLKAGTNRLTLYVPAAAAVGAVTTRWRVSTTGGLSFMGYGGFGEVEDHMLQVRPGIAPGDLALRLIRNGDTVTLSWDNPAALLEEADHAPGPFITVPGAASPFAVPTDAAGRKFYRLRLGSLAYEIPTTGQEEFYNNDSVLASAPSPGHPFYGQDAQFKRAPFQLTDNGDGTVSDHTTGLMWTKTLAGPMSWHDGFVGAAACTVGGHHDWRFATVKELYSLFDCRGVFGTNAALSHPFLDTNAFEFFYVSGARFFDVQEWTSTEYVGTTMYGDATAFGVNFADGRIKGYPIRDPGPPPTDALHYVRYVRGNPNYGQNQFEDLGDGTVFDHATGLMWQKADSGTALNWKDALAYAENLTLAGHTNWYLPTLKQLESIVDYLHSPSVDGCAAINTNFFQVATNESYYWSASTLVDGAPGDNYNKAGYVAFGRGLGYMTNPATGGLDLLDVHGAGVQRADYKSGNPADPKYAHGFGPQGDQVRIYNYVRCVRGGLR